MAVGTLDQALLSVLQVPHAHLRSVCLDRQLLVVDEVHASDPYMRQLLAHLLTHHLGIGGQALLLSATLGAAARTDLVNAGGRRVEPPDWAAASAAPYPALTVGRQPPLAVAAAMPDKTVAIELVPVLADPAGLVSRLQEALAAGARVLVVLNTVARVIALQRAVEALLPQTSLFACGPVIAPHHGRFAPVDRTVLDAAVSQRFGKNSAAGPVLLIGTQTLEQSLDLDADLLLTDLCPMDVLLQRIGRLHRHVRARPAGYGTARAIVLTPEDVTLESWLGRDGPAQGIAGLGKVYPDLRVVRRALDVLAATPTLAIPRDNRRLVEGVTHPEALATLDSPPWQSHARNIKGGEIAQALQATLVSIRPQHFGEFTFNPLNQAAQTRLDLNDLRVRLGRTMVSPFGQPLAELAIPWFMGSLDMSGPAAPPSPPEPPAGHPPTDR